MTLIAPRPRWNPPRRWRSDGYPEMRAATKKPHLFQLKGPGPRRWFCNGLNEAGLSRGAYGDTPQEAYEKFVEYINGAGK